MLCQGGKLGIVLPEGVFGNRKSGYIWDYLRSKGRIITLLDCPRTTFQPSTDTKTNVLFFQKTQPSKDMPLSKTWVGVALQCGHDRRGRTTDSKGNPYPDDFEILANEYHIKEQTKSRWYECIIRKPYYLVPRYYDQSPNEELLYLVSGLNAQIISLKELVDLGHIIISKGHEVGSDAYGTGPIPFIRTSEIANLEVNLNSTIRVSEDIYQLYSSQQNLEPGNILMVVDGRYRIGRSAILTEESTKCIIQSHLRIIKITDRALFDPYEFLLILNMPQVLHQVRNLIFIQSTLGSLGKRLLEIKIPIPGKSREWLDQVQRFKHIITTRARLLAELNTTVSPELDL